MLLNTKSLLVVTKQLVFFFAPKKYKQPAPSNAFLNGVRVQFCDQVKYLGELLNAPLKDNDAIQRQVKSLYCPLCSKQALRHIQSVLSCSKKNYFKPIAI